MHTWKMSTVWIIWITKKYTVATIRGKIETPHTQIHGRSLSLYIWKGVVLQLKLLIIPLEIFLVIICTLFVRFFYVVYTARYLNICNFKDSEAKIIYLFQLWSNCDVRIPEQGVSEWFLLSASSATFQLHLYIMARKS